MELDRALDWKITRLRALENAIGIRRRASIIVENVICVGHQAADFSEESVWVDGRVIEIVSFVPETEIDELYYNTPYYITPQEDDYANEAFSVIREALNEKGMVGIGRVVFGSREHMVAIKPRGNGMVGVTLHYPYKVRKEKEVFDRIPTLKIDPEMIGMAHQLIKSKAGHFQPEKFEDRYEDAIREILNKKQKGVAIRPAATASASGNVIDLMSALKKSLSETKSTARRAPATDRAPTKKATRPSARAARKAG